LIARNEYRYVADVVGGTTERRTITIRSSRISEMVQIDFQDQGRGSPQRSTTGSSSRSSRPRKLARGPDRGWRSLDRSIVVDRHRGSLTFETEPGKGTTFTVLLPIAGGSGS
jgi:signal transduction histidine kinase